MRIRAPDVWTDASSSIDESASPSIDTRIASRASEINSFFRSMPTPAVTSATSALAIESDTVIVPPLTATSSALSPGSCALAVDAVRRRVTITVGRWRTSARVSPRERSGDRGVPASERVGESEGRSPSEQRGPRWNRVRFACRTFLIVRLVTMRAAVEWRRRIREDLVVGDVVAVDVVAGRANDDRRADAQVADERRHRDIDNIVSKSAAVRPSAGHGAVTESCLDRTRQRVAAEDAQPRETHVVWIRRMVHAAAGKPRRRGRQVHLDQIGNEDSRDVGAVRRRRDVSSEHERVEERRQLRSQRVLLEQQRVKLRRRTAVEVFILDCDEPFVEQRIALTADLHEVAKVRVTGGAKDLDAAPARGRVDAHNLLIAAELFERNVERHRMDVESTLRVHGLVCRA